MDIRHKAEQVWQNQSIKEALNRGKPVMVIQPRVEMEWGILSGYTGDGRFFGRSYFDYLKPDKDSIFTENQYFLADCYSQVDPHFVYFLKDRISPLSIQKALKASLETALFIYKAAPQYGDTYYFGMDAYDILINSLRLEDDSFAALSMVLPNDLVVSTQNGFPFTAWSQPIRLTFADALVTPEAMLFLLPDI